MAKERWVGECPGNDCLGMIMAHYHEQSSIVAHSNSAANWWTHAGWDGLFTMRACLGDLCHQIR